MSLGAPAGVRIVSVGAPVQGGGDADTSAIAAALSAAGIPVSACVVIDDDEVALAGALDVPGVVAVIATAGGSAGDSVRRVLARITGARLKLHERMHAALEAHYVKRDRPLPRSAERLALLPHGASVANGADPVWTLENAQTAWVVLLRGALGAAVDAVLVPLAHGRQSAGEGQTVRTFKTAGVSAEEIEDRLVDRFRTRDVTLATLPGEGEVWVRLRARGRTGTGAARRLTEMESAVAALLGDDCYGRDGDTLEGAVVRLLDEKRLALAVAESCTGGLLGHRLTGVPGSSGYFTRAVVACSDEAKQEMLGVDDAILRTHGAVSGPCAEAMARGVSARSGTACGLAVTGVAGPETATPARPAGTVFIGLVVHGAAETRRFRFDGDRASVKWQSSVMALDMLRRRLKAV